jgi:hypothetical protein
LGHNNPPPKRWGLGIKDPEVANTTMGAKLLWRILTGKKDWWKMTITKKYRLGGRKRCMDNTPDPHPGSQVFKIIRVTIPFFKEHLSWIPGNGKMIRLWKDVIQGADLNSCEAETTDLEK